MSALKNLLPEPFFNQNFGEWFKFSSMLCTLYDQAALMTMHNWGKVQNTSNRISLHFDAMLESDMFKLCGRELYNEMFLQSKI